MFAFPPQEGEDGTWRIRCTSRAAIICRGSGCNFEEHGARSNTALVLYKKQVEYSFTEFLQVVAFCQQHPSMTSMTSVQFFHQKTS